MRELGEVRAVGEGREGKVELPKAGDGGRKKGVERMV